MDPWFEAQITAAEAALARGDEGEGLDALNSLFSAPLETWVLARQRVAALARAVKPELLEALVEITGFPLEAARYEIDGEIRRGFDAQDQLMEVTGWVDERATYPVLLMDHARRRGEAFYRSTSDSFYDEEASAAAAYGRQKTTPMAWAMWLQDHLQRLTP